MTFRMLGLLLLSTGFAAHAQHGGLLPGLGSGLYLKTEVLTEPEPARLSKLRAGDSQRSNSEILTRLRNLEQICVMNSPQEQIKQSKKIDERMMDLRKIVEKRAADWHLSSEEAPKKYLAQADAKWEEADLWKLRFEAQSPTRKCELIEILAATAIARVSTIAPSKTICKFQDFVCDDTTDPLFQRDTRRLNWELRHFQNIEESMLPENPPQCRRTLAEMKSRIEFGVPLQDKANRWPLGRAIGMCGRPMSAHYLDEAFFKEQISEPLQLRYQSQVGWKEILDIEEIGLKPSP